MQKGMEQKIQDAIIVIGQHHGDTLGQHFFASYNVDLVFASVNGDDLFILSPYFLSFYSVFVFVLSFN